MSASAEGGEGLPPIVAQTRDPRAAMLLVPVLFGGGMLLAGLSWVVAILTTSGSASGEVVDVRFSSECAAAAISDRLAAYGLPGAWRGDTLRLTLPGTPGDEAVPAALAARGRLAVVVRGEVQSVRVEQAGVQISLTGTPVSLFTLDAELVEAGLVVTIDGAVQEIESVNSRELMLAARGADSTEALRTAADRVTQVLHPLPCDVQVVSVSAAAGAAL